MELGDLYSREVLAWFPLKLKGSGEKENYTVNRFNIIQNKIVKSMNWKTVNTMENTSEFIAMDEERKKISEMVSKSESKENINSIKIKLYHFSM